MKEMIKTRHSVPHGGNLKVALDKVNLSKRGKMNINDPNKNTTIWKKGMNRYTDLNTKTRIGLNLLIWAHLMLKLEL